MNRAKAIPLSRAAVIAPLVLGITLLAAATTALAGGSDHAKKDIVETAQDAGQFNTLVAALERAGLVATLKGDGPFTVFAPTDEAFAQIPSEELEALLNDRDALTAVLTYHVVPGAVTSAEVMRLDEARTVQGQSVRIRAGDGVSINEAKVVKADIMTRNGVIHVIDRVITPQL